MYTMREAIVEEKILHTYTFKPEFYQILEEKLIALYDRTTKTLSITWKGEVSSSEFRNGYKRIIELVRNHKPTKWLLNLRERSVVSGEDKRWIFQYFFPEVLRIVGRNIYMAVILPVYAYPSMIHHLKGDELMHKENFLIIEHFLLQEESLNWLKTIDS